MGESRYSIDMTKIIFEQFEDETVVIDANSGFYFSLSGAGPDIFELARQGFSVPELSERLSGELGVGVAELRLAAEKLVGELVSQGVLVERTGEGASRRLANTDAPLEHRRGLYVPPVLTRYADMRELLLLDPIHEVDERFGWPRK